MKKIRLKSLIDPSSDNIDQIYTNICKELNLVNNTNKDLIKQLENKNKIKNSKTPSKLSIPIKKKDEDLLLSMTKRLNIVEQNLKESNIKLQQKDEEIKKLNLRIKELEKNKNSNKEDDDSICENCIKMNKIIEQQNE